MLFALKKIKKIASVVRITGDDIMVDPTYIDKSIAEQIKINADYTSSKSLPSGTEAEGFNYRVLKLIFHISKDSSGSEYLTNYIITDLLVVRVGHELVKSRLYLLHFYLGFLHVLIDLVRELNLSFGLN